MPIVVAPSNRSTPLVEYWYTITGLVNGANAITLPAVPLQGSFPPLGDWTPTFVYCYPYNAGAAGEVVTPDLTTITNSSGNITFTLYAAGATDCLVGVA